MFDLVQKNKTAVQIVLAMVSLGLVVGFGISGYSAFQETENYLAKVGGTPITERDLAEAVNNQTIPDDMKPSVIDRLVEQKLLIEQAKALRIQVTDASLSQFIAGIAAFQVDGKFDPARYKEMLEQQRMTPEQFEHKLRQELSVRQMAAGVGGAGFVSSAMQDRMEKLLGERRELQVSVISAQDFVPQAKASEDEIKQYYEAHSADFKTPEQVKLEYLVLSRDALAEELVIPDGDIQKYFDEHKQEIAKEERKARHILLAFPQGATAQQKTELKKQAEGLLKEVTQNVARFAEIARQKSQDPGSAANGGDLGWFGRGMMVKAFEEATFSLGKGQISNLVESEFGFHIIKLDDIRTRALADAKPEIIARLKDQKVQSAFQAQSEKFSEIVYQQADSLQPAADQLKLSVRKSEWVSKQSAKEKELSSPKLIEAVFTDDVLKNKHNSEAIEVSPGLLVSARVAEHKPEQVPPLSEVSDMIATRLRTEKALKLSIEEGAARLKKLQSGENLALKWSGPHEVTRVGNRDIDPEQLKEIFRVPQDKLPGYVGGELKGVGYLVYKVAKVSSANPLEPQARKSMTDSLAQMYGQTTFTAYLEALRKQIKVEYKAVAPKTE